MKNIYENKLVEHSANCCSVKCACSKRKHIKVFHVTTENFTFWGRTITSVMRMWAANGQGVVIEVGSLG